MTRKYQVVSDLHVNHKPYSVIPIAGTLLVAGDVSDGRSSIEWLRTTAEDFDRIFFVLGNHELVGECYSDIHRRFRDELSGTSVRVLENEVITEDDGFSIAGCTLWTDIPMTSRVPVQRVLIEYAQSEAEPGKRLTCDFTVARHKESATFLGNAVDDVDVVLTHHLPHPNSVDARYAGNSLNSAFVTDLAPLVHRAKVWVHGHTHTPMDYPAHGCRVVCNPRGYQPYEGHAFQEILIINGDGDECSP